MTGSVVGFCDLHGRDACTLCDECGHDALRHEPAPSWRATCWSESRCDDCSPTGVPMSTYWLVESAGELAVKTGDLRRTNVWYGASQVLEHVLETVDVLAGDELHVLPGGTFLVRGRRSPAGRDVREVRWSGETGPYVGDSAQRASRDAFLRANATRINPDDKTVVTSYRDAGR